MIVGGVSRRRQRTQGCAIDSDDRFMDITHVSASQPTEVVWKATGVKEL